MIKRIKNWFKNLVVACGAKPVVVEQPKPEKKYITRYTATYACELQIVLRDLQVICTDYKSTDYMSGPDAKEYLEKRDPVKYFIEQSFRNGIMHIFDKSNKFNVALVTLDIRKVLYKPSVTITEEQVESTKG